MSPSAPPSNALAQPSLRRFAWLSIAAALTTIALKSVAYLATGSVGLLSDALESLVNLVAAIVALVVLHIAESPPDDGHEWGHEKVEYFASAFEGAAIFAAAVAIMFTAVPRLLDPRPLEAVGVGLIVSCAASLVNLVVARVLLSAGKRHRSITLEADGHHLMTDVWTSVGVVVGVGLVAITKLPILDAVVAILLALNIVWTGGRLLVRSAMGLLDASVAKEERAEIEAVLRRFAEAEGIEWHALRTRQAGSRRFIAVHILVPGKWNVKKGHDLCERIERDLRAIAPKTTVLTHLEPLEDDISQHDKGLDRDSDAPPEDRGATLLVLLAVLTAPGLARADQPAFFEAEASLTAASNWATRPAARAATQLARLPRLQLDPPAAAGTTTGRGKRLPLPQRPRPMCRPKPCS